MMKLNSLLILLAITSLFLYSCKKEQFTESYLRGGNSLIATTDGNMLIAGFNMQNGTGYDGYLLKVDASGNILWGKNFGNTNTDGFNKVVQCSDGGYAVTGFISSNGDNYYDLVIMKTNDQGEKLWSVMPGDTGNVRGFGLAEAPDHGLVACGFIRKYNELDRDIYLMKVDANGNKVWEKRFGKQSTSANSTTFDEAYSIITDGSDGFFVTGSMNGSATCCGTAFLMRLNSDGDSLWTKHFDFARGISLTRTADGNLLICGAAETNGQDVKILKTDTAGTVKWEKTFGSAGYDFGSSVIETSDGKVAFCGISAKSGNSVQSVSLYKLDPDGKQLWSQTYGDNDVSQGMGILQNSDGGFNVAGMSNDGGSFIFLNKTDNLGVEVWRKLLKQ